jgi:hypothetical protein
MSTVEGVRFHHGRPVAPVAVGLAERDERLALPHELDDDRAFWARTRVFTLKAVILGALVALLELAAVAFADNYTLRVTSDTPTFLSLIPQMARHPFAPASPFLAGVPTYHATPYMQVLALAWRVLDGGRNDPYALGRFLAVVGVPVFAFVLAAVFAYVRSHSGSLTAWLSVPVLLLLLGPAHVIWAGDLSFHGLLYAGYFPQNVAIGLLVCTLLAFERGGGRSLLAAVALAALTMLVHPFTGVLLAVLIGLDGCVTVLRGRGRAWRAAVVLGGGFALAQLWPCYSIDSAFAEAGIAGYTLVGFFALLPFVADSSRTAARRVAATFDRLAAAVSGPRLESALSVLALGGVAVLGYWQLRLLHGPTDNVFTANRHLAVYWVEQRWRWPLLFAVGAPGLVGLVRLARRGVLLPLLWFGGCFGVGVLGAAGLPVTVWWRLLLFGQIPLAWGLAFTLVDARRRVVRLLVAAALVATLGIKLASLLALPQTQTYLGSAPTDAYVLGTIIPAAPGLVATDPFTAYYVPGDSGHRVLTVTKAHVGSPGELRQSARGYALLHRFATWQDGWWQAGQQMWRLGVRYVLIQKQTSLRPATLADFSTGPTPLNRSRDDFLAMTQLYYRLNRVGTLVADTGDDGYALWRLKAAVLFAPAPVLRPGGLPAGAGL